jgi:hypothetical protein
VANAVFSTAALPDVARVLGHRQDEAASKQLAMATSSVSREELERHYCHNLSKEEQ